MDWISKNLPYLMAGISVGGQYALIAIGYTMVYGILRLINFAHGDIFMVAGLIMVYAVTVMPICCRIWLCTSRADCLSSIRLFPGSATRLRFWERQPSA